MGNKQCACTHSYTGKDPWMSVLTQSCITHHSLSHHQDKNVVISLTDRHIAGLTSVRPTVLAHTLLCALHCNIVRFLMFCKLHCTNSRMRFDTRKVHCIHCALRPTH